MTKECITHHHACDCREAEFAGIRDENACLRTLLKTALRKMAFLIRDYPGDKESKAWYERAKAALESAESREKTTR